MNKFYPHPCFGIKLPPPYGKYTLLMTDCAFLKAVYGLLTTDLALLRAVYAFLTTDLVFLTTVLVFLNTNLGLLKANVPSLWPIMPPYGIVWEK